LLIFFLRSATVHEKNIEANQDKDNKNNEYSFIHFLSPNKGYLAIGEFLHGFFINLKNFFFIFCSHLLKIEVTAYVFLYHALRSDLSPSGIQFAEHAGDLPLLQTFQQVESHFPSGSE
jgi:hypothetical protein